MTSETHHDGGTIGSRIRDEIRYVRCKGWSLSEVGEFWDSVTDYDDINENTYSYYRRFTNSWALAHDLVGRDLRMLDIQARSGKGTDFWFGKNVIRESVLVDFSDFLLHLADERLKATEYNYRLVKIDDYALPFEDGAFDLVASYETIEHIGHRQPFMQELSRVLDPAGIMILTCPNLLWEPVHWLAAITQVHHSEGPHNFLSRRELLALFSEHGLSIVRENTTIVLPFNHGPLRRLNEWLERRLPRFVLRAVALRRTFVLRKTPPGHDG